MVIKHLSTTKCCLGYGPERPVTIIMWYINEHGTNNALGMLHLECNPRKMRHIQLEDIFVMRS
jgi:hypothetical protein